MLVPGVREQENDLSTNAGLDLNPGFALLHAVLAAGGRALGASASLGSTWGEKGSLGDQG